MRRHRVDGGSASLELVLMTPALIALMLFVVLVGRLAQARADVDRAARDAARAASIARTSAAAHDGAAAAARATLADGGVSCRPMTIDVDTGAFAPNGAVHAKVDCTVDLADLSLLGVPGSRTITATFTQPVDAFRGVEG
ncbi:MAG: TadE/TadG family type IV pilus assembly protein [Acidimicrobiia bacterium]